MMGGIFPADPTSGTRAATWRWLWPVLGMVFAARMAIALTGDLPAHPDETFQYLEQGYRLVHGYGIVPWEYVYGIRSWLIPLGIAGILQTGLALGFDRPALYLPLVQSVLCLISLLLPLGMYRLTQLLAPERAAIGAFLFGCFWHQFLFYAPKPMPDILAVYGLIWMAVWMFCPPERGRLLAFGFVSGLVLTLRYQLLPVVGMLNLFALIRLRWAYGPALAGNLVAVVLAGLLDLIFWGGFLSSFIDNFRLNFMHDIASDFGRSEVLFYVKRLMVESGGLILLALAGFIMIWRQAWPVIVALTVGFLAFHIPAHKELRFVIWIMPFALIGCVIATEAMARALGSWSGWRNPLVALAVVGVGVTLAFSARYTGIWPYNTNVRDINVALRVLSEAEGLTGVELRTPTTHGMHSRSYYGLGRPVPLYLWGVQDPPSDDPADPRRQEISHVVTETGATPPPGYEMFLEVGGFTIWKSIAPGRPADLARHPMEAPISENLPSDFRPMGTRTPIALRQTVQQH